MNNEGSINFPSGTTIKFYGSNEKFESLSDEQTIIYVEPDDLENYAFVDVDYICQQLDTLTKEELEYVSVFCQRLIDLK